MQAMESGKSARTDLNSHSSIKSQQSTSNQHPGSQTRSHAHRKNTRNSCDGCGSTSHGPGTSQSRKNHCPARSHQCEYCSITGHFATVCRKKSRSENKAPQMNNQAKSSTSATVDSADPGQHSSWFAMSSEEEEISFTSNLHINNRASWQFSNRSKSRLNSLAHKVLVPHMEWDNAKQRFKDERPRPLANLQVYITPLAHAHESFHSPLPRTAHSGLTTAVADTGAKTCASGPALLKSIGIERKHLLPTSHRIKGITQSNLDIWGVLLATISVGEAKTNQVIYICENACGLYLSESALHDLGSISSSFPDSHVISSVTSSQETCSCPKRSLPPKRPEHIPFAPNEANVKKLEKWLLDHYGSSAFNVCEHQPLPEMSGKPITINFKPDVVPKAYHSPIPIPRNWKERVKADLDRDVRLGIIEPVPPGTPTIWCSRMVVVAKKNGTPRRTIDLQKLNEASYRDTHHTSSPFNLASSVPPNTRKTILDAWNAYHLLPLSDEARNATTFITEWGRYRYRRGPQGFKASGDAYTKAYYDMTVDIPRKAPCVDDTLLWDNDIESSFWHTVDYLTHCAKNGVVFNPSKFKFSQREIDFAGFHITQDGIKPAQSMLDAISSFPTPTTIKDARAWFGLVNQVAFSLSSSKSMQPFRDLLKPGRWYWDEALDRAFAESKAAILDMVHNGIRAYEPQRPTCLCTDWSKEGLARRLVCCQQLGHV